MHSLLLLAWVTLGASAPPFDAQDMRGVVTASDGRAVAGATVLLAHVDAMSARRVAVTDASGHFRIVHLAPGAYRVTVEHPDYRRRRDVHTQPPGGASLHVFLPDR